MTTTGDTWRQRAHDSWAALVRNCRTPSPRGVRVHEPRRARVVFAWPLSQVLHSGVLLEAAGVPTTGLGPDEVWRSLRRYRRGDGFLDIPVVGRRYYDDNAWIGLACAQRALSSAGDDRRIWLRRAEGSLQFVSQAIGVGGGVRWVEGGTALHACSTGSVGLLAATTAAAAGRAGAWRGVAADAGRFLDTFLVRDDGLIADSITLTGQVDHSVFTYNQGLAIQLRIDRDDLLGATALAEACVAEFAGHRFVTHVASFNAIFCRALLRLEYETGEQRWREFVAAYLDRCWERGRDRRGLLVGVGKYDKGIVLDHAALVGVMAALCLTPEQVARLA